MFKCFRLQNKISIIVTCYNQVNYIEKCISCLQNQTYKNLEIICVDDFSDDGSWDIINDIQKKDSRIKVIHHNSNLGTLKTRKDGIALSTGKYIMFCDGDDFFNLDICELALQEIQKYKVDFLQFNTSIINYGNSSSTIKNVEKFLKPDLNIYINENIIDLCFVRKVFSHTLWNKIYRADIVRKASSCLVDGYYKTAEDLYMFFFIAYFAHSCMGCELYGVNYRFGVGITTTTKSFDEKQELIKQKLFIIKYIKIFLKSRGKEKKFHDAYVNIFNNFLHQVYNIYESSTIEQKKNIFLKLCAMFVDI